MYPFFLSARANPNPNKINYYSESPLYHAAAGQHFESIQLLLRAKANPNLADKHYQATALHDAIGYSLNTSVVELLLSAHANPNLKNREGNTSLHYAALWPELPKIIKTVQLLLQYGAQVNIINNKGSTPLQLIAINYYEGSYNYSPQVSSRIKKMGRLLVWYHYILLPHFIKQVPEVIPEKAIVYVLASHLALLCAENKTVWS